MLRGPEEARGASPRAGPAVCPRPQGGALRRRAAAAALRSVLESSVWRRQGRRHGTSSFPRACSGREGGAGERDAWTIRAPSLGRLVRPEIAMTDRVSAPAGGAARRRRRTARLACGIA